MNYTKIKKIISEKNISITYLCSEINISHQGLNQMIRDKSMKIETLEKIAIALKIDVRDFFDENNANDSEKNINQNQVMFGNGTQTNNSNNNQKMNIIECEKEVAHLRERVRDLEQTIVDKNDIISLLKNK